MTGELKFVQISVHFEYGDAMEKLLDRLEIAHYVRYPMMEGRDRDGKHFGTQVFPGNFTIVQALVPAGSVDRLFEALRRFREQKPAHQHLEAIVLPIERRL
jgi:hypothetical protein